MRKKTNAAKPKRRNMRQEIASTALELFASHGYDSVSTTEIAQAVGVSQPNIHYYFKNKNALWRAAVEELSERIRIASEAAISQNILNEVDPLSALKLLMGALHRVSREVPELGKMIYLEGQAGGERLDWLIERVIMPGYELHLGPIRACIDQKLIKPYPPHQILLMMHGAVVSYYNAAPLMKAAFEADPYDQATSNQFSELCIDAIFSGLRLPGGAT